jgi:hypothetical protein
MKRLFLLIALSFAFVACGSSENFLQNSESYTVQESLDVAGTINFSFQRVYLYRSISIDASLSSACASFAKDHEAKTGVAVLADSLKLSYEEPVKRCARRNAFNQCETHQYIYTFQCRYQLQGN